MSIRVNHEVFGVNTLIKQSDLLKININKKIISIYMSYNKLHNTLKLKSTATIYITLIIINIYFSR